MCAAYAHITNVESSSTPVEWFMGHSFSISPAVHLATHCKSDAMAISTPCFQDLYISESLDVSRCLNDIVVKSRQLESKTAVLQFTPWIKSTCFSPSKSMWHTCRYTNNIFLQPWHWNWSHTSLSFFFSLISLFESSLTQHTKTIGATWISSSFWHE